MVPHPRCEAVGAEGTVGAVGAGEQSYRGLQGRDARRPLVDRINEMQKVFEALLHYSFVQITGPAMIGKSTLARRAVEYAARRNTFDLIIRIDCQHIKIPNWQHLCKKEQNLQSFMNAAILTAVGRPTQKPVDSADLLLKELSQLVSGAAGVNVLLLFDGCDGCNDWMKTLQSPAISSKWVHFLLDLAQKNVKFLFTAAYRFKELKITDTNVKQQKVEMEEVPVGKLRDDELWYLLSQVSPLGTRLKFLMNTENGKETGWTERLNAKLDGKPHLAITFGTNWLHNLCNDTIVHVCCTAPPLYPLPEDDTQITGAVSQAAKGIDTSSELGSFDDLLNLLRAKSKASPGQRERPITIWFEDCDHLLAPSTPTASAVSLPLLKFINKIRKAGNPRVVVLTTSNVYPVSVCPYTPGESTVGSAPWSGNWTEKGAGRGVDSGARSGGGVEGEARSGAGDGLPPPAWVGSVTHHHIQMLLGRDVVTFRDRKFLAVLEGEKCIEVDDINLASLSP